MRRVNSENGTRAVEGVLEDGRCNERNLIGLYSAGVALSFGICLIMPYSACDVRGPFPKRTDVKMRKCCLQSAHR